MFFTFNNNMNTSVKTIKVLHTSNGKSVWKFCTTSDGSYIARKNGWMDVKVFKSWNQMIYQYNHWLGYTDQNNNKTFSPGYPKAKSDTITPEATPEIDQALVDALA